MVARAVVAEEGRLCSRVCDDSRCYWGDHRVDPMDVAASFSQMRDVERAGLPYWALDWLGVDQVDVRNAQKADIFFVLECECQMGKAVGFSPVPGSCTRGDQHTDE